VTTIISYPLKTGAYHLLVLTRVFPNYVGYLIVFRPLHLSRSLHVLNGSHLLSSLAIMLSSARTMVCEDLQKNLTPEPSHSTLQDSTAMKAAAFVAE
jgi:hypothetical protein